MIERSFGSRREGFVNFSPTTALCAELSINQIPRLCVWTGLLHTGWKELILGQGGAAPHPSCTPRTKAFSSLLRGLLLHAMNIITLLLCPLSSTSPSTFSGVLLPRCKEEYLYECVYATIWVCVGLCHQGCCVMARGYLICKAGGLLLLYTHGGKVTGSSLLFFYKTKA